MKLFLKKKLIFILLVSIYLTFLNDEINTKSLKSRTKLSHRQTPIFHTSMYSIHRNWLPNDGFKKLLVVQDMEIKNNTYYDWVYGLLDKK